MEDQGNLNALALSDEVKVNERLMYIEISLYENGEIKIDVNSSENIPKPCIPLLLNGTLNKVISKMEYEK